jgi:hypothetical protein
MTHKNSNKRSRKKKPATKCHLIGFSGGLPVLGSHDGKADLRQIYLYFKIIFTKSLSWQHLSK